MYEYGFLMVAYDKPEIIKRIQDSIPEKELYNGESAEEENQYGLEKECHVTLVPCLDKDLDVEKLKKHLMKLEDYGGFLANVSKFDNDRYDVLKCDVGCYNLYRTNAEICHEFPTHSEYKEYHPHMTIAYLKKGMADKYLKDSILGPIVIHPTCFMWSGSDSDGNDFKIRWN